jgi:hypothetical protein
METKITVEGTICLNKKFDFFSTLTDSELEECRLALITEESKRKENKKAEAWKDVVKALKTYLQLDDITVYYSGDNHFMNLKDDFSIMGMIVEKGVWEEET